MSSCHKLLRIKLKNGKVLFRFVYNKTKYGLNTTNGYIKFNDIAKLKDNKTLDISDFNGVYWR